MTSQNYIHGDITVTPADLTPLLAAADDLATGFMNSIQALRGNPHILENPCMLYSPTLFQFGEYEDLRHHERKEKICEIFLLPFWMRLQVCAVAELLLQEEAETFRSLMHVGLAIGAIEQRGTNRHRQDYLFETMNEFAALAYDKMHLEACV